MAICLPFLKGNTEERPTAKIENASFLVTGEVSDEEQDDTTMYESRVTRESNRLRTDIKHQRDFYCVGSNVWSLVSEKFGYDVELGFKVVEERQQGVLGIDLITQKVPIPVTGWFDYHPVARIPTDVVSDEDDDLVSVKSCDCLQRSDSICSNISLWACSFPVLLDCRDIQYHNRRMTQCPLLHRLPSSSYRRLSPLAMSSRSAQWTSNNQYEIRRSNASATEVVWEILEILAS